MKRNRKERRSLEAAIRSEIDRRGLTTGEVAKLAGISTPHVSNWFHRRRTINVGTAEKMAKGLGITSGPM